MQFDSGFIVGTGGIFGGNEISKMKQLAAYSNSSSPVPPLGTFNTHPLVASLVTTLYATIPIILTRFAFPEITAAIMQCIAILMVTPLPLLAIKNEGMHGNFAASLVFPLRIKALIPWVEFSSPIPLIKPVKILSIDNGVLTLRQGNQSVGLVKRLNNCVSFYAAFHRSTSNGLLEFSRYFSMAKAHS